MKRHEVWQKELTAAKKRLEKWHKRAEKTVNRYLDNRNAEEGMTATRKLNLFHSDVSTLKSMLYGTLPKISVDRRFNDANDDIGRVASLIMERLLNNDVQANGEEYTSVLRSVLEDRLIPGLGCAKVRYTVETEMVQTPAIVDPTTGQEMAPAVEEEKVKSEDVIEDYYHWRDVLWGWARNWKEVPWVAFRSYLTEEEATARFDEKKAKMLDYKRRDVQDTKNNEGSDSDKRDPADKAEIWECYDKSKKMVEWYSTGCDYLLDSKEDPLGLKGFFPCPPFLIANSTTSLYDPVPDYYLAQDLYSEIDVLHTRISIITKAIKAAGVYDSSSEGVERLMNEGTDNILIPVENWAAFGEKGGLQGSIEWMPLKDLAETLNHLRGLRDENIALLHQVTGLSDIMRGQGSGTVKSAAEQQIKAKFSSVRVQALQDEFAQWASDLLELKAEVISKHFEPKTIAERANVQYLADDQQVVMQAVMLVKEWDKAALRVTIRPESVAMVDYADLKAERTEYINALAIFLQSAAPLVEMEPGSTPMLLELLKWGLAGFKGSQEIEGVLDRAIAEMQKPKDPAQQKPDPKAETEKMKQQTEGLKQQGVQQKQQGDAQLAQLKMKLEQQMGQMELQQKQMEMQMEQQAQAMEFRMEQMRAQFEIQRSRAELSNKQDADAHNLSHQKEMSKIKTAKASEPSGG